MLSCNSHKYISPSTKFFINTPKPTRGGTRCTYNLPLLVIDDKLVEVFNEDISMWKALSSHIDDGLHKAKPAMCIFIQTQIIYVHIFRGSLVLCMKTILTTLNFHIHLSPLKTSTSLSSITKKGEIVSASSATPSWFWSIDDKPGWGTNVFVRIAG